MTMPSSTVWLMASLIIAMRRSTRKTPGRAQAAGHNGGNQLNFDLGCGHGSVSPNSEIVDCAEWSVVKWSADSF
jgi:hypothetical protein